MDTVITTVQTRGQITLPLKYREKLGIKPGDPVSISLESNRIVIQPVVIQARV